MAPDPNKQSPGAFRCVECGHVTQYDAGGLLNMPWCPKCGSMDIGPVRPRELVSAGVTRVATRQGELFG